MKSKFIALAVAGLVSAPAFAQSNVQIYGVMDLGFARHGSSRFDSTWAPAADKSRNAIDSGNQAPSRIGFRGTEDLGNGLKVFFQIEQGLFPDVSSQPYNRQAFVGVQGDFGKIRLGRDFNPVRELVASLDPFGAAGVGSVQNILSLQTRLDNAILYTSPNLGGFTVEASFTNQAGNDADGDDELAYAKGTDNPNTRLWNVVATYRKGPLMVGAAYERARNDAAVHDFADWGEMESVRSWHVAASYDFGVVDLRAVYGRVKIDWGPGWRDEKARQWMVGGVIPVSEAGKVLVSYARQSTSEWGGKASQWAVGYTHALSKRTSLYGTYAKVSTNSDGKGWYGVAVGSNEGIMYTSGLNLGLRHNF